MKVYLLYMEGTGNLIKGIFMDTGQGELQGMPEAWGSIQVVTQQEDMICWSLKFWCCNPH